MMFLRAVAVAAAYLALADAFQAPGMPLGASRVHSAAMTRSRPLRRYRSGVRMQEDGGKTTSPDVPKGQGEMVEISREELTALAKEAGINVKTPSQLLSEQRQARREADLEVARGPNVFTPFIEALQPVMKLPNFIQYPLLLFILGAISLPFSFLSGSGSLGDKGIGAAAPPSASSAPSAVERKVVKKPTAQDPFNTIAPKELQINRKSCDVFPYSLTPTCTDPNIGEQGILKNLDKYTNKGWKEKAGIADGSAISATPPPAANSAPAQVPAKAE